MSKAEERALEKYPKKIEWVGNQWDGAPFDVNSDKRFYYQQGYKEAEKDLDIISWVKKVSGVKEMKRAEEEALKAYSPRSIAANYAIIDKRDAFEYGYLKAEKDLELTWEDIKNLYFIFAEVDVEIELCKTDIKSETIGYYQEVLKRFKNLKHVK